MKRVYLSKGWVFAFLLILGACSSEDYLFRSVPSSFGEKESMQSRALRQSLERQIDVWNYTQELCSAELLIFDQTVFSFSSKYGWVYEVPYVSPEGIVEGSLLYRTTLPDNLMEIVDLSTVELKKPIKIDDEFLRNTDDIPYILSCGFKDLSQKGLKVSPELRAYADSIDVDEKKKLLVTRSSEQGFNYIGDKLDIVIKYDITPGFSYEDGDYIISSISEKTFNYVVQRLAYTHFSEARQIVIHNDIPTKTLYVYILKNNEYFTQYEADCRAPMFVKNIADDLVYDYHLSNFKYEYDYYGVFYNLPYPNPEPDPDPNSSGSTGGYTGSGGGSSSGGETSGSTQDDDTCLTLTNFHEKVLTENLRNNVKTFLKINPDSVTVILVGTEYNKPTVSATYKDGKIFIYDQIFNRNYTRDDMESCVFHEYVHASQPTPQMDKNGKIKLEWYEIPYSESEINDAKKDYSEHLARKKVPEEGKVSPEQEALRNAAWEVFMSPYIDKDGNPKKYKIEGNIQFYENERGAYEMQLDIYGDKISKAYRKELEKNLNTYIYYYEHIKKQHKYEKKFDFTVVIAFWCNSLCPKRYLFFVIETDKA